jgi:hypothetical protein
MIFMSSDFSKNMFICSSMSTSSFSLYVLAHFYIRGPLIGNRDLYCIRKGTFTHKLLELVLSSFMMYFYKWSFSFVYI